MEVRICPVCNGRQTVPWTLYLSQGGYTSVGDNGETICRSCDGKGYITVPRDIDSYSSGESSQLIINLK